MTPDGLVGRRDAVDAQGGGRRRTPTWRGARRPARRTTSSGCRSGARGSTSAGRPALTPSTQQPGHAVRRQPGPAQGAARFSRLEGAVYDHGWIFLTSTQGGGLARAVTRRPGRRLRARAAARSGPGHQGADAAHALRVAERRRAGLPGQRHDQRSRHPVVCEDGSDRQLPARPDPHGRAVRHRQEQPAGYGGRQRVRRRDVQPGRRDAVRQHAGRPSGCRSRSGGRGAASASDPSCEGGGATSRRAVPGWCP